MTLHGQCFVGNQLSRGSGETFQARSPLDGSLLETAFFRANERDVDEAMRLGEQACQTYRLASNEERAAFLEAIAEEILGLGDSLILRTHLETGLPNARLENERARTVGQLRMFAQVAREGSWVDARIDTAIPDRQPVPKPDLRRMLMPIGPVIVFGSSNFPFAYSVAGGDTASALATGNPVIVKAHSGHPGASELVATAVHRAATRVGLPEGVFSMLHGVGNKIGTALVRHPCARAVGFTGSRAAGRALFDVAAARQDPIPVFAEMSSLNPIFILPEAMRERGAAIAEGLRTSITTGVGQFCTKPGLVFGIKGSAFNGLEDVLGKLLAAVAPATMLHAGICESYHTGLARASAAKGVAQVSRSGAAADISKTEGESVLLKIDVPSFLANPDLREEVFGPFSLLTGGESLVELETAARALAGQLTATVHGTTTDLEQAMPLLRILERKAGRLIVNGFPTGVEVCPSMNHGGPYPATTDVRFTSVGTAALLRFVRPICYQNFPATLLPQALKNENPLRLSRIINGVRSSE